MFHHDNAPVQSNSIVQQKLTELKPKILPHPPDFAPSDFHRFPKFKTFLAGMRFRSNEAAIEVVNGYFGSFEKSHFLEGIEKLEKR